MARLYTEAEVVAELDDLTPDRLEQFIASGLIAPLVSSAGPVFDEAGVARLQLLCDLAECYELPGDGMALVVSLIDQLNTARGDIRALMRAVSDQPDDVRGEICRIVRRVQVVTVTRG